MTYTEAQIKTDITSYIQKSGGPYNSWYVGITKDPRERLFTAHSVDKDRDLWIYMPAQSESTARKVEEYFVKVLGTDGGSGGGDFGSNFVYAYKKNSHTQP